MSAQSTAALQAEIHRLKLEVHSLKTEQGSEISIGNYLLARLEQLGVTNMFGVPGDFNLGFLDLVEDHPTINWVGNCKEARLTFLISFGVGELSAVNGIAGGKSIVMSPKYVSTALKADVAPYIGGRTVRSPPHVQLLSVLILSSFDAYTIAARQFTHSQASLKNKDHAAAEIDRVLIDCITKARPVYLSLPTDLVTAKISTERLHTPLTRSPPPNNPQIESFVIDLIVKQFEEAEGDAVVLVDACAIRHGAKEELNEFLRETKFPVYSTPMGKTAVDENFERYGGVNAANNYYSMLASRTAFSQIYLGSISRPEIRERVESAKLVLSVGGLRSDFNTGNFSYHIPVKRTIELHSDNTKVQYAVFPGIGMKELIPRLTERLKSYHVAASKLLVPKFLAPVPKEESETITHNFFWPRVASFFKPHDVIVTETGMHDPNFALRNHFIYDGTGTANFGILDVPLPEKSVLVSQILWGSIGWSVGEDIPFSNINLFFDVHGLEPRKPAGHIVGRERVGSG
ncbi:hypothetical protein C0995_014064 [Termitomyces sp. Mi166|nr:hypothetical protein C0995_014064 [Termitomyces sp. Mi166\